MCEDDSPSQSGCTGLGTLLADFNNDEGLQFHIYDDGKAYQVENGNCLFEAQYFDPDFYEQTYIDTDSGTFVKVDNDTIFKPIRAFEETFEGYQSALDLIRTDLSQEHLVFSNFTLQSPATPEVDDYNDLKNCILAANCDFIDNRFELAQDPVDANNSVLKFYSLDPTQEMVTAKCSMTSDLVMFKAGDDLWFEAKYYLESGIPTTLVDFESSHFLGYPGPRIIFRNDQVAVENKFLDKLEFVQNPGNSLDFPINEWVKIKVHLNFDTSQGVIQVWQDDQLIIDAIGQNIPLDNWIMNALEIGISATSQETTIYMDDVRLSDQPF